MFDEAGLNGLCGPTRTEHSGRPHRDSARAAWEVLSEAVRCRHGERPKSMIGLVRVPSTLVVSVVSVLGLVACGQAQPVPQPAPPAKPSVAPDAPSRPSGFDSLRARDLVELQVAFGPRVPSRAGHRECRDWIVAELTPFLDDVEVQSFTVEIGNRTLPLSNIVARHRPDLNPRILLGAHWDTRPIAERDPDPALRETAILGGNDGGSGVAVLMELGRLLDASELPLGVDLAFFDGEDYGDFALGMEETLLGSQRFAKRVDPSLYKFGVILGHGWAAGARAQTGSLFQGLLPRASAADLADRPGAWIRGGVLERLRAGDLGRSCAAHRGRRTDC